jgi:hypothetical protein
MKLKRRRCCLPGIDREREKTEVERKKEGKINKPKNKERAEIRDCKSERRRYEKEKERARERATFFHCCCVL